MNEVAPIGLVQRIRKLATGNRLKARLIRGGIGSASIQAVNRILGLVLAIVLARSLGAEAYGIYAYAYAIMTLLMVVAEAGVPTLLMREVSASQVREEWGLLRGALRRGMQYVSLMATSVSVMGLLVLWWWDGALSPAVVYTMGFMLLVLPVLVLCKSVTHALRGLHRVVIGQAIDMLIRPLLVVGFVSVGFLLWPGLREPYYAMAAQFVGATIVLFIGVLTLRRFLPTEANDVEPEYRSRDWLRCVLPFTLIGGAGIINNHSGIIMLGWLASAEDVGIYRVAMQGAVLVTFGLQAANAVIAPQFARLYVQGEQARLQHLVTISARVILLTALPVAMVFIFAGDVIVGWVFGPMFTQSYTPLAILTLGQLISAALGSVGFLLNMTGHERDVARTLLITAALNIILNLFLIPAFGLAGAASATAISLALWNITLHQIVKRRIGINSTIFVRKETLSK